jgi:hypothetical protein
MPFGKLSDCDVDNGLERYSRPQQCGERTMTLMISAREMFSVHH